MNLSNRKVDLHSFFPFSSCEDSFLDKALSLGKCVNYDTGESVLFSGSPAKHCGVILSGQAVAFKIDDTGKRYQLCLEEGCFIGLETINSESQYTAKIVALTELEIFFWNNDGLGYLIQESPEFADGLRMMDEGRSYQEKWLIAETDITDPVLCSIRMHWLSLVTPALMILPIVIIALAVCSMLIQRYSAAWLLALAVVAAAGSLMYRQITARANERVIATSKNLILVPHDNESEMTVTRLSSIQSLSIEQNLFERLIDSGKLRVETEKQEITTPQVRAPQMLAEMLRAFGARSAAGRPIPLRSSNDSKHRIAMPKDSRTSRGTISHTAPSRDETPVVPPFRTIEFRAHWALLAKMLFKPLLVFGVSLYAMHYFRNSTYADSIKKILTVLAVGAVIGAIYQFFSWRNHRFYIEEDRVKDYSHNPFSREDLNMAMNNKIQSVRYEKNGFFQVLFNYGTVYILAGEGELSFDYVSNPQRVQEQIMDTCTRYEAKRMQEEEARRRAYISDLFTEIRRESEYPNIENHKSLYY